MNFLKILWQHVFQKTAETSALEADDFSGLKADFSAEPFSGEHLLNVMQEAGFEELVTEDGSLRFRFDGQKMKLESEPEEFALQVSELLLEFKPPSFPDEGFELEEPEMQGLDENFWEKYIFDEDFARDIPHFAVPEFHSLPYQKLILDERDE